MIKANELRIGNFISDDEGVLAKINGFAPLEHSVRCDEEEGCKLLVDCYHVNGSRRSGCETDSPECNPIPLSPEWLERCGFEKAKEEHNNYYIMKLDGVIAKQDDGWYHRITDVDGYYEQIVGVKIEFVHQLQNRFQSLTGEELNVKL